MADRSSRSRSRSRERRAPQDPQRTPSANAAGPPPIKRQRQTTSTTSTVTSSSSAQRTPAPVLRLPAEKVRPKLVLRNSWLRPRDNTCKLCGKEKSNRSSDTLLEARECILCCYKEGESLCQGCLILWSPRFRTMMDQEQFFKVSPHADLSQSGKFVCLQCIDEKEYELDICKQLSPAQQEQSRRVSTYRSGELPRVLAVVTTAGCRCREFDSSCARPCWRVCLLPT